MDKSEIGWWDKQNLMKLKCYDVSSLYPSIMKEEKEMEKCYEVVIDELETKIIENVQTITFSDGALTMFDSEGSVVAYFHRHSYKFFSECSG